MTIKQRNTMRAKYIILIALISFAALSCNKFLDEKPTKGNSALITTAEDLNAILNAYQDFYRSPNKTAFFSTDDNGFSATLYEARPFGFDAGVVQFSLWDTANLPQTDRSDFSGRNFWSEEYSKIFKANLVLDYLAKVSGTNEEKNTLKCDAHFIRAYSYWQLANIYCLPYTSENELEPGLPLKLDPTYDLVPRSSLQETYKQIEMDLLEALKTPVPLVQNGINRAWRANKAAVNGFAARFYLNQNNYVKALQFADASLQDYGVLLDYNTNMRYGNSTTVFIAGQPQTINFPYTHDALITVDPTDALGWKELLYYRILINSTNWFIPSQELISLYDQNNDLRFKYHCIKDYSYVRGFTFPPLSYPGYVFFFSNGIPEGPTVAEMVLIKAECLARSGDVPGAMTAVNELYVKRTLPGTPALSAASKEDAIAVVLKERRRELPFSQRWFDIRRFNNNSDASDDVSLSRTFFPYTANRVQTSEPLKVYTLPKGSRRFASPIPLEDITNSNGLIKQNSY